MVKAIAATVVSIAALLTVPVASAEPGDGLDANRLTCDLWAQGVPPSAIFDRLVRDFGMAGEDALGLIDSANPDHSAMCSEV